MSFVWQRQFVLASCIWLASNAVGSVCLKPAQAAASAKVDVWEIRQQSDQLGPVVVYVCPTGVKFTAEKGGFSVFSKSPTWKVIGYNDVEHTGYEISIDEWPKHGLKMFNSQNDMQDGVKSVFHDPLLKMDLLQSQVKVSGRYFGSEDPALFRSAKKTSLAAARLRTATQIKLDKNTKKVVEGIYSLPYSGGFPVEFTNLTTDGGARSVYKTESIKQAKVDPAIFNYPKNYRAVKDKFDVYVTHKQRKTFEEFLDVFTDNYDVKKSK